MAIKKTSTRKSTKTVENKKIFNEIYTSAELFFTQLGFSSWKSMRTRIGNKLGMSFGDTLKAKDIYEILNSIANSSSKSKKKAQEFLELFKNNEIIDEIEEEKSMPELSVSYELMKKYDVYNIEDIQMKYKIMLKEDDFNNAIKIRLERYKFEYDKNIVRLLKEMFENDML